MSGGGSCTARLGGYEKLVNVTGRRLFLSAAVCALLACSNSAAYAAPCADPVARAVSVQGTVEARPAGSESTAADAWSRVKMNDSFCPGDAVRTSPDSRADLLLGDQSVLRVAENTTVVVQGVTSQRSYIIDLLQGAGHFFSRTGETNLEVKTPYTVAGVRGTEFSVDVGSDAAVVRVFEGTVLASNDSGSAMLASGQSAVAERGKAPLVKIEARPRDAVRWALYYDPVLYQAPGDVRGSQPWQKALAQSQQAYRDGDTQRAFAALQSVPDEAVTDPRFFTYRASLRLAVGQVTAAEADVAHVLASEPTDPEAIALRTVIALANNENDAAMQAATTARIGQPRLSHGTHRVVIRAAGRVQPRSRAYIPANGRTHSARQRLGMDAPRRIAIRVRRHESEPGVGAACGAIGAQPLAHAYRSRIRTSHPREHRGSEGRVHARHRHRSRRSLPRLGLGLGEDPRRPPR